jgi:hypothetical protein
MKPASRLIIHSHRHEQSLFGPARTLVSDLCLERQVTQVCDGRDAVHYEKTEVRADEQAASKLEKSVLRPLAHSRERAEPIRERMHA